MTSEKSGSQREQPADPKPDGENRAGGSAMEPRIDALRDQLTGALDVIAQRKAQKLQKLAERREKGELSPHDFDLNFLMQLAEHDLPLTRKDVEHQTGKQAVVLSRENFDVLGIVSFIHASGERMDIEAESLEPGDVLILYPEELGDESEINNDIYRRLP